MFFCIIFAFGQNIKPINEGEIVHKDDLCCYGGTSDYQKRMDIMKLHFHTFKKYLMIAFCGMMTQCGSGNSTPPQEDKKLEKNLQEVLKKLQEIETLVRKGDPSPIKENSDEWYDEVESGSNRNSKNLPKDPNKDHVEEWNDEVESDSNKNSKNLPKDPNNDHVEVEKKNQKMNQKIILKRKSILI